MECIAPLDVDPRDRIVKMFVSRMLLGRSDVAGKFPTRMYEAPMDPAR